LLPNFSGITLIEVPYWWDRKQFSLASSIFQHRPDLFSEPPIASPIPSSPPSEEQRIKIRTTHFLNPLTIPGSQNTLMTATMWNEARDPTGWYMTEKFDGVRLYWNGTRFYTRQGKKLAAADPIVSLMPAVALDGELW
jgi:hypothetical protein